MSSFGAPASPGVPGFSNAYVSHESSTLWQTNYLGEPLYAPDQIIDSTAVDAGNTPTYVLRPGLVMARLDSGAGWVDYDPDATDGSQRAAGILVREVNLYDYLAGGTKDTMNMGAVAIRGRVVAAALINLDQQARNHLMQQGFVFDDRPYQVPMVNYGRVVEKSSNYSVAVADHGFLFIATTGAVTFTLPPIAPGLSFEFLNAVDANMTVASSAGDDMVVLNDLSADSVAFSTAGEKIGGRLRVDAVYIGGTLKWIVSNLSPGNTITAAT